MSLRRRNLSVLRDNICVVLAALATAVSATDQLTFAVCTKQESSKIAATKFDGLFSTLMGAYPLL